MPVNYTYKVENDIHSVIANEEIDVVLRYGDTTIISKTLEVGSEYTLPITVDGDYLLSISNLIETDTTEIYFVNNLMVSLIKDIFLVLCDECGCKEISPCLSKEAKKLVQVQNIFNKATTFHLYYIPKLTPNQLIKISTYLSEAFSSYKCDVQSLINSIIKEECVTGMSSFNLKLYKLYLFILWSAMYFLEKYTEGSDIEYLNTKYFYNNILECTCDLCIDITKLEELYSNTENEASKIYSFQFDSLGNNISNINLLTDEYLTTTGIVHLESSLLGGKTVPFATVGRYGFVVKNTSDNPYRIFDILENDITDIAFDTYYDALARTYYYVSKEYIAPASIYFKFVK